MQDQPTQQVEARRILVVGGAGHAPTTESLSRRLKALFPPANDPVIVIGHHPPHNDAFPPFALLDPDHTHLSFVELARHHAVSRLEVLAPQLSEKRPSREDTLASLIRRNVIENGDMLIESMTCTPLANLFGSEESDYIRMYFTRSGKVRFRLKIPRKLKKRMKKQSENQKGRTR